MGAVQIKKLIEDEPSFGYRTVAWLLGFNKNTVQRVFQLKGWQVRKRPVGARPCIEATPSFGVSASIAACDADRLSMSTVSSRRRSK